MRWRGGGGDPREISFKDFTEHISEHQKCYMCTDERMMSKLAPKSFLSLAQVHVWLYYHQSANFTMLDTCTWLACRCDIRGHLIIYPVYERFRWTTHGENWYARAIPAALLPMLLTCDFEIVCMCEVVLLDTNMGQSILTVIVNVCCICKITVGLK